MIYVIGFCPPFPESIYNRMIESGNYRYLEEIPIQVNSLFKTYNFEYYDYSSGYFCNSDDSEFIDGFHGGEVTYIKILIDMLEHGSVLENVSDLKRIKEDLQNKKNRYIIY